MQLTIKLLLFIGYLLLCSSSFCQTLKTQDDRFNALLSSVSEKFNVSIISEGEYTNKKEVLDNWKSEPSLTKKISEIAQSYGYIVINKNNVFLLQKNYLPPGDIPDISEYEAYAFSKNFINVISRFNQKTTDTDVHDLLRKLVQSTRKQDSESEFLFSSLSNTNKEIISSVNQYMKTQFRWEQYDLESIPDHIKHSIDNTIAFKFSKDPNELSYRFTDQPVSDSPAIYSIRNPGATMNGKQVVLPTLALSDFSNKRNLKYYANLLSNDQIEFRVSDSIANKKLSVIKHKSTSTVDIIHAISKLFNLQITHKKNTKIFSLDVPRISQPANYLYIPQYLKTIIPSSLYLCGQSDSFIIAPKPDRTPVWWACLSKLKLQIKNYCTMNNKDEVSISQLPNESKSLFAYLILCQEYSFDGSGLVTDIYRYINNHNEIPSDFTIKTRIYKSPMSSEERFFISVSGVLDNGKTLPGFAFGDVILSPK